MKNNSPLVTVILRTHNRADLLDQSIRCLLNQSYRPIEILVVDHNSKDDTKKIIESFGNKIRYIEHKGSFRDTFNIWRNNVEGRFISFLDDDDYIIKDCIQQLVTTLIKNPSIDVVFGRHRFFHVQPDRCVIEKETKMINFSSIKRVMLSGNPTPMNAVLFRADCLKKISPIDSSITGAFDWFFWMQMASAGCIFYQINEVLGYIRRSHDSVQFETERMIKGALECINYYGCNLNLKQKLFYGYYRQYGYRLICYGIICLEKSKTRSGRQSLLRGILLYLVGFKKRSWLLPAILIYFFSIVSNPTTSREKVERIFRTHLYRNYHQK
jgi:glycosyltransferase involved in cell wall biosynthesis